MGSKHIPKSAAMAAIVMGMLVVWSDTSRLQAQDDSARIEQGIDIAPVPLNLAGKDRGLVGLGSYLVNALGDCNGCHSSGTPASLFIYNFKPGGNPYFGQPEKLDPSVYLNGGTSFGTVGTPTGSFTNPEGLRGYPPPPVVVGYAGPAIITRNLTPNYAGVPEGGMSLSDFKQILSHGTDFDHVHPSCTQDQLNTINNPPSGVTTIAQIEALVNYCIPGGIIPFTAFDNEPDGALLQIMPWVTFSHLTDHDMDAIYEYLSAIPCIDNTLVPGPDGDPNEFRNDCAASAVAAEKPAYKNREAIRSRSRK